MRAKTWKVSWNGFLKCYMWSVEISNIIASEEHRSHVVLIILFLLFTYVFLVIQQLKHCIMKEAQNLRVFESTPSSYAAHIAPMRHLTTGLPRKRYLTCMLNTREFASRCRKFLLDTTVLLQ